MTGAGGVPAPSASADPDAHRAFVERSLGRRAALVWTDNRCVFLSVTRRPGGAEDVVVRLHRSFLDAPRDVWASLGRFFSGGPKRVLAPARAHFERWRGGRTEGEAAPERRRGVVLRPGGTCYDLREILGDVARGAPFGGLSAVGISWAKRGKPGAHSVRLGSYRAARGGGDEGVIRVHPLLDRASVPRFVVEHVVHHELVHHLLAVTEGKAAGRCHGAVFRRLEAQFGQHGEAERWLREQLPRLLRAARRGR